MAQASPSTKARPTSPHLEIWRWGPAMFVSILHRVSGNALAVGGLATLLYWLGSLAAGVDSYTTFAGVAGSWYGRLVLIGISWSYFNHLSSGIRHLIMDIGAGYELVTNARWSVLTPIIAIILTAAFWAAILLR
jgi:succinate dehydrogenase / fumarate reductase cytochrome b subunit